MTFSSFFFNSGAAAGGGIDLIPNSLRFRGSQYLTGPTDFGTPTDASYGCLSVWVKNDGVKNGGDATIIRAERSGSSYALYHERNSTTGFEFVNNGTMGGENPSTRTAGKYRDYSAWQHVFVQYDAFGGNSGGYKMWINGVQEDSVRAGNWSNDNDWALTEGAAMNARHIGNNGASYFSGYIAELHVVDGQVLDVTDFGEFNADGVWVPKDVTLATVSRYSDPGYEAAFDGNSGTFVPLDTNYKLVASGLDLTAVSSVGMVDNNGAQIKTIRINGTTELSVTGGGSVVDMPYSGPVNTIEIRYNGSTNLTGVRVDGVTLLDDFGDYGVNGFALDFSDPGNIGADRSGNGHDFTPSGFELSDVTSSDYDWMEDSPTKNYSTLNPLFPVAPYSTSKGNLDWAANSTNNFHYEGTQFSDTGRYYWEIQGANASALVGAGEPNQLATTYPGQTTTSFGWYGKNGQIYVNTVVVETIAAYTTTDTLGFLLDNDALTCELYKNGEIQTTINLTGPAIPMVGRESSVGSINFGQRPFIYPPGQATSTDAFKTVLYTGNGATQSITGVGFSPDLVWIKNREVTTNHVLQDTVRGETAYLVPNTTGAENTNTANDWFRSFDADGFTVAATTTLGTPTSEWNNNGSGYVAWCFNAGDGAAVTNNDGTIQSTVKASPDNGFSVVTFTAVSGGGSIGHGLGSTPSMLMVKSRNSGQWNIYHKSLGSTKALYFTTGAEITGSAYWNNTSPDDSTFTVGSAFNTAGNMVAYCFADTDGKVKTGAYTGNGTSSGPYVELGFKPAMVLIKATNATETWIMMDSTRPKYSYLYPNQSDAEGQNLVLDFHQSGFQPNVAGTSVNTNTVVYTYIAFAENFTEGQFKPTQKFNTVLWTGDGTASRSLTGVGFSPDLVWIKNRDVARNHSLHDTVRGTDKYLISNSTGAELTDPALGLASFDSDGFTLGTSTTSGGGQNGSGEKYVAWCFNAGDGAPVTNTDGTITSTVKADPSAGFSVVTYTGTGSPSSIGHGLNSIPTTVIVKNRDDGAEQWHVYHKDLGSSYTVWLNSTAAKFGPYADMWNSVDPTSTTFTVGTANGTNKLNNEFVAYCFADTDGLVKTGSYIGNGSTTGPYVDLGFSPSMIMVKRSTGGTGGWIMLDKARHPSNPNDLRLEAQSSFYDYTIGGINFLTNGFNLATNDGEWNASGSEYVYIAFAQEFDETLAPEDLQSANLEPVDIKDPSEHFQTVLGGGSAKMAWSQVNTAVSTGAGNLSIFDGLANQEFLETQTDTFYGPTHFAKTLNDSQLGGYSDWYIPSYWELDVLFRAFKPTTASNSTVNEGANNYAVPQQSAITSGSPTQTTLTDWQVGGSEAFSQSAESASTYYTSSPGSTNVSWGINFDGTNLAPGYRYASAQKYTPSGMTRAIRREPYTGSEPAVGSAYAGGYFAGLYSLNADGNATHALIVAPKATGEYKGILDYAQGTFSQGLWWIKDRQNSNQHQFVDSVRGGNLTWVSPNTTTEQAYSAPSGSSVAWCWNLVNDRSNGFDIVTYTGASADANGNQDVPHNLGYVPDFVMIRNLDTAKETQVWHSALGVNWQDTGYTNNLVLNTSAAQAATDAFRGQSATHIRVGANSSTNNTGDSHVMYLWRAVPGFSSIGTYTANANTDGPMVNCGFRPAFIMVKNTSGSNSWVIIDSLRDPYNQCSHGILPNATTAEGNDYYCDLLSNGFKIRSGSGYQMNATSGHTYIYIAFAEHPSGGSNVAPSPAR